MSADKSEQKPASRNELMVVAAAALSVLSSAASAVTETDSLAVPS